MIPHNNSSWVSRSKEATYLRLIEMALDDNSPWAKTFRCSPDFYSVVGITEPSFAIKCFQEATKNAVVLKNINNFRKMDDLFLPLMTLKGINLSTDICRHIRDAKLIQEHFPNAQSITEFGSNVGMLAYCLKTIMPQINNYYLLDLPQVTQLASKCLKALMPQQYATLRNFHDDWQKPRKANDVLVSICALTEMENWLWYYDSLVPKAGQGMYLEVNFPDEKDVGKLINLLNKDFSSVTVIKETVVKHPDKIIIAKK